MLMLQQIGRIHAAAFSDEFLYQEVLGKAYFWVQPNFYGVDVTSLYNAAVDSYFAQVKT
jgi:histone-arginine methyltransferase CARM1